MELLIIREILLEIFTHNLREWRVTMRKKYPYLEEPYVYNLNEEQEKRSILGLIDDFVNQRQYVNITLLD
jgi:hypothetical protein